MRSILTHCAVGEQLIVFSKERQLSRHVEHKQVRCHFAFRNSIAVRKLLNYTQRVRMQLFCLKRWHV
ncbi:hypothetical protein LSAT2_027443 [Lamellibrachia satsuma]|nr:hypothetical protein LSAT2_027443 [Lamellibrachia satsuma]